MAQRKFPVSIRHNDMTVWHSSILADDKAHAQRLAVQGYKASASRHPAYNTQNLPPLPPLEACTFHVGGRH